MPETYDEVEDVEESSVIKELRKQLRDAKAEAAEVGDLRRKVALNDAGLSGLSGKQQRAILAAHDGDVMDTEGLKATAVELGMLEAPAPPEPQVSADEQAAHQRIDEATSATEAAEAHPETLEDRINKAQTQEEVLELLAEARMLPDYGEAPTD